MRSITRRQTRLAVTAAAVAAATVFAVPWIVPMTPAAIYSDSQAAGFSNRFAIAGLTTVCLLAALLSAWTRKQDGTHSNALIQARDHTTAIPVRLTVAFALLCTAMTVLVALIVRSQPVSDGGYFMNSILRVIAGGTPYAEIQFSYGPLMLYLPIGLWRLIEPLGLSPFVAYYVSVAASHIAGLTLIAYVLDRLTVSSRTRRTLFVAFGVFSSLWFSLGLNYTSLRFIAPYAALMFIGETHRRTEDRPIWSGPLRLLVPTLLIGAVGAWSPEMGIAALAGTAAAFTLLSVGRHPGAVSALVALAAGSVALGLVLSQGSIGSFLGGSYNLPILPGIPQSIFVGSMMMLAWTAGQLRRPTVDANEALSVGMCVSALALIAPALGRSDFVHTTWNGLGAFMLAAATLNRGRWQMRYTYLVAAVSVSAMVAFSAARMGLLFDAAAASGAITEERAVAMAALYGKPEDETRSRYQRVAQPAPTPQEVSKLLSTPQVAFLDWLLSGPAGVELALHADLVPTYSSVLDGDELHLLLDQLDDAQTVVVPRSLVDGLPGSAVNEDSFVRDGVVYVIPDQSLTPAANGLLFWVPIRVSARNPVIDVHASLARYLDDGWSIRELSTNYAWLVRTP